MLRWFRGHYHLLFNRNLRPREWGEGQATFHHINIVMLILSEKKSTGYWLTEPISAETQGHKQKFTTEAIYSPPIPQAPLHRTCTKSLISENPRIAFLIWSTGQTRDLQTSNTQPLSPAPNNTAQSRVGHGPTRVLQRAFRPSLGRLLTCSSRGPGPGAARRRLGLRVVAGAVRGLWRLFFSAPSGGRLGAFTGHGRWGRVRAGS